MKRFSLFFIGLMTGFIIIKLFSRKDLKRKRKFIDNWFNESPLNRDLFRMFSLDKINKESQGLIQTISDYKWVSSEKLISLYIKEIEIINKNKVDLQIIMNN